MLNFDSPIKKNKILIPDDLDSIKNYQGRLYGYNREDTGVYVVVGWDSGSPDDWENNKPDSALKAECIGGIIRTSTPIEAEPKPQHWGQYYDYCGLSLCDGQYGNQFSYGICGELSDNGTIFYFLDGKGNKILLQKDIYSITQDLFSRNSGILETDIMKNKTALIVGCGSVGSIVALQLARSGVAKFVLIDTDTLEIHNICRHQCNFTDVGRYKTNALRDRIITINPYASVTCYCKTIENVTDNELNKNVDDDTIIISCADNRLSNAFACDIAYERKIPFISIGFWTRAFVCEIVICLPKRGDTCYRCALKKSIENGIEKMNKNHFYIGEEDKAKTAFEPGISIDIEFGTSVASKAILDILNLNNNNYISKVLHTLTQYTLVCNTNNEEIGGNDALLFSYPLQVVKNIHFEKGTCNNCKSNCK